MSFENCLVLRLHRQARFKLLNQAYLCPLAMYLGPMPACSTESLAPFPLWSPIICLSRALGGKTLCDARFSFSEHQDFDTCVRLTDKAIDIGPHNRSAICLTSGQRTAPDAVFLQSLGCKLLLYKSSVFTSCIKRSSTPLSGDLGPRSCLRSCAFFVFSLSS